MMFGFCYKNRRGEKYWLHKTSRGKVTLYYFSKESRHAVPLPRGFVIVENERTGLPVLRKK
jgi:hypothetical protein